MTDNILYKNIDTKSLETTNTDAKKSRIDNNLDKNAFLNLLVTQMKYQDPLNPTSDKDFLAQMAQFSSLEQMQNLSKSFSKQQGSTMIGKYVEATIFNEATKGYENVEGTVSAVVMKNGETYLIVGEKQVPVDKVSVIYDDDSAALQNINKNLSSNQGLNLIGKYIQAITLDKDYNPSGFVEGRVDYVKFDQKGNAILMVGDKEIFAVEVTSVSDKSMLIGSTIKYQTKDSDASKEGVITDVKIKDTVAYLIINGEEVAVEKINYINDAIRLVGTKINYKDTTGNVDAVVIKNKIPYLNVGGNLISFKDYKGIDAK